MAKNLIADFEAASRRREPEPLVLRLYVAGGTPRSLRATRRIRKICTDHPDSRHDLAVVDVHREPQRARDASILAIPTLVKESPLPRRVIVGDLGDEAVVLSALGLARSGS